ncbi:MAG: M3 family metallopeptidase [Saprospiraceae bacterium]|jgi:peptidyl-dipeptidase Dcp|nr:M3 family metallopeptidase [Saprospiraceae bacterium]
MKLHLISISLLLLTITFSCKNKDMNQNASTAENPLLSSFTTPYGVPPFDLIKDEHYKPAFEAAMAIHKSEIDSIANITAAPDFNNTIVALDGAGSMLSRISNIFFNMTGAHTNDTLEKISVEMAPVLAKHYDYIALHQKLFERVKSVWDNKASFQLNEEQNELLEKTYKSFIRNGALLGSKEKEAITKINEELSSLTVKFGQNTLAEVNDFKLVIDKKEDLKGLSEDLISAAADAAKDQNMEGKWLFTLHNPSVMPFLQYAENRGLRQKIWDAMQKKGSNGNKNDNNEIIKKIASLRVQRANLLGYPTHAHYVLEEQMAKNPDNVNKLLSDLWKPAISKARNEVKEIQDFIKSEGGNFTVEPQDWRYYAEKIRQQKYALDENEIKQYFSLENVHQGVFSTVQKLFGLTFKERKDLPTYHPEATAYEVNDADGSFVGILYMDFHPRESKRGGAWMTSFSDQKMKDGKRVPPVISIVCNFTKPTGDTPALLTFDEVSTYFHEFGHALHGLLSNVNYTSLAGTNVPTDFVELPSQIMENWALEPEVLKSFAKHYKTGEVIPDALIQKIKTSGTYGQGFATTEYLSASMLDMDYHTQKQIMEMNATDFEKKSMDSKGLISEIIPRYRSTYFNHIFSGGYSSGYYSYIWSEVLDSDAFESFKSKGLFDKETAMSFRKNILEKGGTADAMELYKRFKGAEPKIDPLLKKRGLN